MEDDQKMNPHGFQFKKKTGWEDAAKASGFTITATEDDSNARFDTTKNSLTVAEAMKYEENYILGFCQAAILKEVK